MLELLFILGSIVVSIIVFIMGYDYFELRFFFCVLFSMIFRKIYFVCREEDILRFGLRKDW